MTDIVKRLRAANTTLNEGDCCGQLDASGTCTAPACIFGEALKMTHDAAAEIERLRAALGEIAKTTYGYEFYMTDEETAEYFKSRFFAAQAKARTALKEDGK